MGFERNANYAPDSIVGSICRQHPCPHNEGEPSGFGMHNVMFEDLTPEFRHNLFILVKEAINENNSH